VTLIDWCYPAHSPSIATTSQGSTLMTVRVPSKVRILSSTVTSPALRHSPGLSAMAICLYTFASPLSRCFGVQPSFQNSLNAYAVRG
jgi:hypothetical protein